MPLLSSIPGAPEIPVCHLWPNVTWATALSTKASCADGVDTGVPHGLQFSGSNAMQWAAGGSRAGRKCVLHGANAWSQVPGQQAEAAWCPAPRVLPAQPALEAALWSFGQLPPKLGMFPQYQHGDSKLDSRRRLRSLALSSLKPAFFLPFYGKMARCFFS